MQPVEGEDDWLPWFHTISILYLGYFFPDTTFHLQIQVGGADRSKSGLAWAPSAILSEVASIHPMDGIHSSKQMEAYWLLFMQNVPTTQLQATFRGHRLLSQAQSAAQVIV